MNHVYFVSIPTSSILGCDQQTYLLKLSEGEVWVGRDPMFRIDFIKFNLKCIYRQRSCVAYT